MRSLFIEGNDKDPNLHFDKDKGLFEISGVAISENVVEVFIPVFEWINEYVENPNEATTLKCSLTYCNTAASKQVFEVIKSLKACEEKSSKYNVIWEYDSYDDDMLFLGKSIAELLEMEFDYMGFDEL